MGVMAMKKKVAAVALWVVDATRLLRNASAPARVAPVPRWATLVITFVVFSCVPKIRPVSCRVTWRYAHSQLEDVSSSPQPNAWSPRQGSKRLLNLGDRAQAPKFLGFCLFFNSEAGKWRNVFFGITEWCLRNLPRLNKWSPTVSPHRFCRCSRPSRAAAGDHPVADTAGPATPEPACLLKCWSPELSYRR